MIAALLMCMLCSQWWAQTQVDKLPASASLTLNRRFPGWKFAEVSQEVRQFFESEMKGRLPYLVSGDFDGNGQTDHAALIRHGEVRNTEGPGRWPRFFLVVFLRKGKGHRMHVIKNPDGEYLSLAKKGTQDFNYDEQKEITYANDAIITGIFEKAGSSYVYENGRFRSFLSSD
ncbi:MAG TPA: hypothetical protein VJU86_00490 [Pyrinomonadaceae bacterium]|nr:hypothetical protein [Pyrinomonadaceae bacterium]